MRCCGFWLVVSTGLAAASSAAAQTTLDEGTFRLLAAGREIGRETFSIKRTGSGADIVTVAHSHLAVDSGGTRKTVESNIQLRGETLRPVTYQECRLIRAPLAPPKGCPVKTAGDQWVSASIAGRRVSAMVLTSASEQRREYLVDDEAIIANGFANHYGFLVSRVSGASARVPLLVPSQNRQVIADVSITASAAVNIAGTAVPARRMVVQAEGEPERRVWVDEAGHVLRLEIPALDLIAERTAPPRPL
jgi:hypothetical protein